MEGSCFWAQGISRESGKIKGCPAGGEKLGRGVRHRWERQSEITVLLVPKGINKVRENLAHARSFATTVVGFLGFKMIYFHILGPK